MSRSKRKYLFQNDQNTLNGALLAGNNSMAEMLLWSLVLLPPVIGVYGAGERLRHIQTSELSMMKQIQLLLKLRTHQMIQVMKHTCMIFMLH